MWRYELRGPYYWKDASQLLGFIRSQTSIDLSKNVPKHLLPGKKPHLMDRRHFLSTLSVGILSLGGCTQTPTDPVASRTPRPDEPLATVEGTWPTHQFDAARTGHNPVAGMSHDARSGHWTVEKTANYDRFAVGNGLVYIGTVDGRLRALDATTGAEQWSKELLTSENNNEVRWLTITLSNGTLYCGNDLELHALDLRSREVQWVITYDHETDGEGIVVADDMVVAQTSSTTVAGYASETGTELWEFDVGEYGVTSNLASDGTKVYFHTVENQVFALDLATGEIAWQTTADDVSRSFALAVAEGKVIITSLVVEALDAKTGDHVWRADTRGRVPPNWLLPVGRVSASGGPQASPPAIAHGKVFLKREEGKKGLALDIETGDPVWAVKLAEGYESPVVAGEHVYFVDGNTVRPYEAESGEPTGNVFTFPSTVGTIIVLDGVVFATSGRGYYQALTGSNQA